MTARDLLTRRRFLATAAACAPPLFLSGCRKKPAVIRRPPGPAAYVLQATREHRAPDGHEREIWVYNGRLPGPTLRARYGEVLRIKIVNELGVPTTAHWHGMHQPGTWQMDGVEGVTQPGIPDGGEFIYEFLATPSGTHWYHSHAGVQYGNGLFGPLIVEGPQPIAAYDREEVLFLNDWFWDLGEEILPRLVKGGMDKIAQLVQPLVRPEAVVAGVHPFLRGNSSCGNTSAVHFLHVVQQGPVALERFDPFGVVRGQHTLCFVAAPGRVHQEIEDTPTGVKFLHPSVEADASDFAPLLGQRPQVGGLVQRPELQVRLPFGVQRLGPRPLFLQMAANERHARSPQHGAGRCLAQRQFRLTVSKRCLDQEVAGAAARQNSLYRLKNAPSAAAMRDRRGEVAAERALKTAGTKGRRQALKTLIGYLTPRLEMMRYAEWLAQDLVIGSGQVEGRCVMWWASGWTARAWAGSKGRGRPCCNCGASS